MLEKLLMSAISRLLLALFGVALVFSPRYAAAAEPLVAEAIISAPIATVWQAFTTREGYASVGVARAEIDLTLGGLVQVQPDAQAKPGDAGTTSEILSFEPGRLLSLRTKQAPGFADSTVFGNTWTIVYLTPLGADMTHVRVAGFGFNEGTAAAALTRFFEQDQAAQMHRVEKKYWPLCELCKQESAGK